MKHLSKRRRLLTPAGWALLAALVAVSMLAAFALFNSIGDTQQQKKSAQHSASVASSNAKSLADQVKDACSQGKLDVNGHDLCQRAQRVSKHPTKPIPGPPGPAGDKGDQGAKGDRGPAPTQAAVMAAVSKYCASGSCQGKDGQTPSQDDIAAAVATYCDANGDCRGPQGEAGKNGDDSTVPGPKGDPGKNGADGANGKDAPAPTQKQINAAVATYCANGNCKGDTGKTGPKGDDGVSIVKVECPSSGDWKITLSDGTVQRISGPCRVAQSSGTPTGAPTSSSS